MRSRRLLRASGICGGLRRCAVHRKTGLLGTGGAMQRREARMDERDWRLPKCRRDLHWMHDAGLSGQIHAVYESAAGFAAVVEGGGDVWKSDTRAAQVYAGVDE